MTKLVFIALTNYGHTSFCDTNQDNAKRVGMGISSAWNNNVPSALKGSSSSRPLQESSLVDFWVDIENLRRTSSFFTFRVLDDAEESS